MNSEFTFAPVSWVPFKDQAVMERLRRMTREELLVHPNPDFKIYITPGVEAIEMADMFTRIKASDDLDKPFVMISGNPCPGTYLPLVNLINRFRVNCRNLICFTMDEWADDQGNIAPLTYKAGFGYSFFKYFINRIDEDLRPQPGNIYYHCREFTPRYSELILERGNGGADACYSGPGWTGHVAFIEPGPEFTQVDSLDEYLQQKTRIVALHPLTIAQNSLHGVFGQSGDVSAVPPKAATIGPFDVLNSRFRMESHDLTTGGSFSSWQRMVSRLITHGPVTPLVPGSIFQKIGCTLLMGEEIAKPIECMETVGY